MANIFEGVTWCKTYQLQWAYSKTRFGILHLKNYSCHCLPKTSLYFTCPIGRSMSSFVDKTMEGILHSLISYCFKWSLSKEMWNFSSQDSILKTTTPLRITACVIDDNYKLQNTPGRIHDQSLSRWWHLCRLSPTGIFSISGETGEFPFFQRCLQHWCKTKLSECTFWLWLKDVLNLVYSLLTWSRGKW